VTADRQKGCLENKAQPDGEEVEPHRPKNSASHLEDRVRDRHQKTDR